MYCKHCHAKAEPNDITCRYCGYHELVAQDELKILGWDYDFNRFFGLSAYLLVFSPMFVIAFFYEQLPNEARYHLFIPFIIAQNALFLIPASIYFVRWFKLHRRLRREQWQKTEGKVVDSRVVRFITPSYYPIIEYNASGVTRRFVSKHSGASETIGEKVDVIYNPNNPLEATYYKDYRDLEIAVLFAILEVAFTSLSFAWMTFT